MTTPGSGETVRADGSPAVFEPPSSSHSAVPPPLAEHGPRRRRLDRRPLVLLAGVALLVVVMAAGIALGSLRIPLADVWAGVFGDHSAGRPYIVWNLRLPRVLLAALVGMNLALAGGILQSVTRNPLADPHLLGLSAGGALASVLALHYAPGLGIGRLP